jgi:membrane-bound lytic murein transglycosylase D
MQKTYISLMVCLALTTVSLPLSAQEKKNATTVVENESANALDSLVGQQDSTIVEVNELVPDTIVCDSSMHANYIPDSVFIQRLNNIISPISFPYNDKVRSIIEYYTVRKRDLVERMLGTSEYYFPIFEQTLDAHDVPLEMKYLPVIESAINPVARSRAGACGMWQFMFYTGKLYGLEINSFVDERYDPVKETEAAARYLKNLYNIYSDWHLALAAYNCGPGNVNKAIRRSGGKKSFWELYNYLPKETRRYVPSFIAAAYTMEYYKEHNLMPRPTLLPTATDTIMVSKMLHFDQIAYVLGISVDQIKELNPQYRRNVIPGGKKAYPLRLPADHSLTFASLEDSIYRTNRDKYFAQNQSIVQATVSNTYEPEIPRDKAKVHYTVKSGDTPGLIADWFDVYLSDLKYWNNIHRNMIKVGQRLVIYVPKNKTEYYQKLTALSFADKQALKGKPVTAAAPPATVAAATPVVNNGSEESYIYYTVRNGDNLWSIAKKFPGVTNSDIMALNNITDARKISIGQKLKIKKKS